MRIVEIKKLKNGGHRNQIGHFKEIPEDHAVIPDNLDTPNFPFGEIETEKINGVMTVTKWTPGEIPKVETPNVTETEEIDENEKIKLFIRSLKVPKKPTQPDKDGHKLALSYKWGDDGFTWVSVPDSDADSTDT